MRRGPSSRSSPTSYVRTAPAAAHLHPVTTPTISRGVPAGPVRAHLVAKVAEGATLAWLAEQSGASEKTIQNVLHGKRPTVYAKTAARLLAVTGSPPVPKRRVDPAQTLHEVTELHGAGWPLVDIAKVARLSEVTLLESNLATGVTAETEARVHHAWRVLHRRHGPAPRPYPWLAELLAGYPVGEVAAGAGVDPQAVRRLSLGRPVGRATARRVCAWAVVRRQVDKVHDSVRAAA